MKRAAYIIGWIIGYLIAPAVVAITAYGWGYRAGSNAMRDTIMCVMDRVSGEPIGKGTSAYCIRIGEAREARK